MLVNFSSHRTPIPSALFNFVDETISASYQHAVHCSNYTPICNRIFFIYKIKKIQRTSNLTIFLTKNPLISFQLVKMMADFGGQLGLWSGVSVMTCCELAFLIFEIVHILIYKDWYSFIRQINADHWLFGCGCKLEEILRGHVGVLNWRNWESRI